ncbi:MAG: sulfite exporter TauE/SafE family protein [Cyclobacteriaceae bacterium]|nr:sulfite exporter TauE/SafE family protein [Cytophagales bacterium]MBX2901529.1 sulfite exporter TauE/SafE family protein [Cyclobacteriaceae bacterium]
MRPENIEGEDEKLIYDEKPELQEPRSKPRHIWVLLGVVASIVLILIAFFGSHTLSQYDWRQVVGPDFLLFVLGGFIAQMIDGSLGMAYGVSATTFLLSFGISPAASSASVHTAEIFTSGVSGLTHLRFQNVNKKLFKSLLIPGMLGAVAGAYILFSLEAYNYIIRPLVAVYTLILGFAIIRKAVLMQIRKKRKTKNVPALAAFGGFMDSVGGGGWGPIVTTTLIARGRHPRYTIGSVNLAEFFVSFASSLTFFATIGLTHIQIIAGLILGGIIAAPIAAKITQKLPVKRMMILVGVVVILVSIRLLVKSLAAI